MVKKSKALMVQGIMDARNEGQQVAAPAGGKRSSQMKSRILIGAVSLGAALMAILWGTFEETAVAEGPKRVLPIFQVDANFPTLPDHMEMGGVGGVNADSHGNVWVFQRPHTIEDGNSMD